MPGRFGKNEFHPYSVELHNGKKIQIRTASLEDAASLIELAKGYIKNNNSIPLYLDEFDPTIEFEQKHISNYIQQKNSILLLAEYEGKLIGNIDLTGNQRRKLYHTAMIGMGLHNDWRNLGLGTFLMEAIIQWAIENPYLQILWLQVYEDNKAGLSLYKKVGFEITGYQKNMFHEENGQFIGNYMMTLYLNQKDPSK